MDADDAARFLADTPERRRLLSRLRDDPGSPAELAAELPLSRRSVQRNLSGFVERGWAEKRGGAYRLTAAGAVVADEHAAYVDALAAVETHRPLYEHLPDGDRAPDPRWLADADAAVAEPDRPQAPIRHYVERLGGFDADRVRMLSPVLSRAFHDAHAELALRGARTELVMSADLLERARSLDPAAFAVVAGVPTLSLFAHPEPLGFGLTVGGDELLLCAYDGDGQLRACVSADEPAFVAWAEDAFERHRARSRRVRSAEDLPSAE